MTSRKASRIFSSFLLGGLLLGGCVTPAGEIDADQKIATLCENTSAPAELSKLTVLNSGGLLSAPYLEWGIREGCFAKYGLSITSLPGGESMTEKLAALVGGSADLASDTVLDVLTATANSGSTLRLIAGGYEFDESQLNQALTPDLVDGRLVLETALVAGPGVEYRDISSLVGAKVGITPGGGPNPLALERLLKSAGLKVNEVEFVGLQTSERLEGLERGDLQFAILAGASVFEAMENGSKIVLYPGAYIYEPSAATVWFSSSEITAARSPDIKSFQLALNEVHSLLKDQRNFENFKTFLEVDFGVDVSVLANFSMPNLVTRELTTEEFLYWVPILVEEEIVQETFTIPKDLIFQPY